MNVTVRIKGIDQYIRGLAATNLRTQEAAVKGVIKAAEHLKKN